MPPERAEGFLGIEFYSKPPLFVDQLHVCRTWVGGEGKAERLLRASPGAREGKKGSRGLGV